MRFERTSASVFQAVSDMSIKREHTIASLLRAYEAEQESSEFPNRTHLYQAKALLEARLGYLTPPDRELVELGHSIYRSLGAWHEEIALLRRFLATQALSQDEQAWTRWHIVDCLALAGDAHEAVEEQQTLFRWATRTFPLDECFFVIADGTQARSWFTIGHGYNWLSLYEQFSNQAPCTIQNRLDRFYSLRTAVHLCLLLADATRAQFYVRRLSSLLQEDALWSEGNWVKVEVSILEITLADKFGSGHQVRMLAQRTIEDIVEWERSLNIEKHSEVGRFRSLCHNLAAPLYRGRQYDLAIPLLQKAVYYHTKPHYTYLWLAASLWQTTHRREKVIPYLQQAIARYDGEGNPYDAFQQLPEFRDVRLDPGFFAATTYS